MTGTTGQDDDRLPPLLRARGRRAATRADGHGREPHRRRAQAGGADDARGDRPPARLPRDARRRRPERGARGDLARIRARPPGRRALRRARVHEPDRGAPGLPRHDGALLRRQAPALRRRRPAAGRRQRGRRPRPRAGRASCGAGSRAGAHLRFRRRRRDPADGASRAGASRPAASSWRRACAGASTSRTCSPRSPSGSCSTSRTRRSPPGVAGVEGVPGRFETVDEGQPFTVVVDYSHKPGALEHVLRTARELATGRVLCVFGCGGDRDRGKRPLMGRIAADLADLALVTSDNPRSEDPDAIIDEVVAGAPDRLEVEPDRRAAIERALEAAGPGDVVVIAGKGHEQGQEIGGTVLPFDDREVAREALRSPGGEARDPAPARRGRRARPPHAAPAGPTRPPASRSTRASSRRATCSWSSAAAPTSPATPSPAARPPCSSPTTPSRLWPRSARPCAPAATPAWSGSPARPARPRRRTSWRRSAARMRGRSPPEGGHNNEIGPAADARPDRAGHRDRRGRDGHARARSDHGALRGRASGHRRS